MNTIENRDLRMRQASARAAAIRACREEIKEGAMHSPASARPPVLATRIVVEDGRLVTRLLIDGSRQLGRGARYWI